MKSLIFVFFALFLSIEGTQGQVDVNQPLEVYVGVNYVLLRHLGKNIALCETEEKTIATGIDWSDVYSNLRAWNSCTSGVSLKIDAFCSKEMSRLALDHNGQTWTLHTRTPCFVSGAVETITPASTHNFSPIAKVGSTVTFGFAIKIPPKDCDLIALLERLTRQAKGT